MIDLKEKQIFLFAPKFFNYDVEIKKKLESNGAKVDLYDERPSSNFFIKATIRLYKKIIVGYIENYFENIINQNKGKKYDYILVIKGEVLDVNIINKLKSNFPDAKTILYLWDSLRNYRDITKCLPLFDKTLTFDLDDSQSIPSLIFRPLFYIDEYANLDLDTYKEKEYKYDLLFIGTIHSDRWLFLKTVKEEALKNNLKIYYYLYIQSPIIFLFRKLFDKNFWTISLKEVRFRPISKDKIIELTAKSRAILDIQHPKQTGLTIRTIEVTGAKRKLITTNTEISKYDFYSAMNILVVDRNSPAIPSSFWNSDFYPLSEDVYTKYSLSGWLKDVFDF